MVKMGIVILGTDINYDVENDSSKGRLPREEVKCLALLGHLKKLRLVLLSLGHRAAAIV